MERTPQKAKQTDVKSAQRGDFDIQAAQTVGSQASILQMQRTIGNRATVQRLRSPLSLSAATEDVRDTEAMASETDADPETYAPIQRAALMTGAAMLDVAPRTTGFFGGEKTTAYNTLVDALENYWTYARSTKRQIKAPMGGNDLTTNLQNVIDAAQAWLTKHGASKKAADAAKQPAVHKTFVAAHKLKKDIDTASDRLIEETKNVESMYASSTMWARMVDWSTNVWYLDENTNFYTSLRTFTTVQEGRTIIKKHLLDTPKGGNPMSPELFNVSGPLFERAAALLAKPDAEVTVDDFQALFAACVGGASQIWGDLTSKARNDAAQAGRDSFVFGYISTAVPDLLG